MQLFTPMGVEHMSMLELQNSRAKNFRCRDSTELAITKRGKELGGLGGVGWISSNFCASLHPQRRTNTRPGGLGWGEGSRKSSKDKLEI